MTALPQCYLRSVCSWWAANSWFLALLLVAKCVCDFETSYAPFIPRYCKVTLLYGVHFCAVAYSNASCALVLYYIPPFCVEQAWTYTTFQSQKDHFIEKRCNCRMTLSWLKYEQQWTGSSSVSVAGGVTQNAYILAYAKLYARALLPWIWAESHLEIACRFVFLESKCLFRVKYQWNE